MRNVLVSLALLAATGCSLMIDPDGVEPIKIVSSIAVTPATATVPQGATRQLAATATYADGSTGDVTAQAAWTSSAAGVATVSSAPGTKGLVTAAAASGSATITATFQGKTATSSVTAAAAELASVAVTAATGTVVRGTTLQLTATATYTDATTANVTATATWTTSDADVASVSTGGLVTGVAAGGPVTFTATFGTQSGSLAVTVTVPAVTSVVVTPSSPTVLMGSPQQLTAVAFDSGSQMTDVSSAATWSSSDPSKATVSASGLVTPVAAGQTTITATYATKSGTATVTVPSATVTLTSIAVTPSTPTVAKGATAQLTATATFSDSSTDDVTEQASWTSGTAAVATVSDYPGSKGSVAGVAASGTAIITATFGGQSGTATVTAAPAAVASIAVTPATATVAKGATQQLVATATYTDATTANVTASATWTTSAAGVASVSTAGLVTAAAASGSATISAALAGKTGSATVTAAPAVVASIAVTPPSATVANGATQQLVATATYTDATTSVVTSSATWTTSNPSVATVSSAGLVTGVAISGTTTITAALAGKSGTAVITAAAKSVTSIEVTPVTNALSVGEVLNLVATAHYSDATTAIVTTDSTTSWQSSAPGVATVSNTGSSKGRVTALSESGTAVTITATFGGRSGTATVTVSSASVESIAITPASPETGVGATVQLTATATYTDTTTQDVTSLATWSSGTASVAIVDDFGSKGLVTGVSGPATASISATFGGQVGIKVVTVRTIASIAVTPSTSSVPSGTTVQLAATATLTGGGTQNVTANATWSSNAAGIATVSDAAGTKGLVTAVAPSGSATISAVLSGRTGTATVTGAAPLVASIAVTPATVSLAKGTTQQLTATATYTDATTGNVTQTATWTTANAAVATVTSSGTRGVVTGAGAGGPVDVTATLGGQSGSTVVTVTGPVVTSVAVTPSATTLPKGSTQQLTATATYSDATTTNVTSTATWTTSSGAIASVTAGGLAKAEGTSGTATLTATFGGKSGTAAITAGPAALASIELSPSSLSIPVGGHQQFTVTATYTDGTTQDRTSAATFIVTPSTPAIVTVGAGPADKGMLRAVAQGTAAVTATLPGFGYGASCGVTVGPVAVVKIEIELRATSENQPPWLLPSLAASPDPFQAMATGTYSDGRMVDLTFLATWSSNNPTVVSVSNEAATRGRGVAATPGSATLSAAFGGVTGSLPVTVHEPVEILIVPFPEAMNVPFGTAPAPMRAIALLDDWTFVDITATATWSSSDETVVTVGNGTQGGVLTGVGYGSALVSIAYGGMTGSAAVIVNGAVATGFSVWPSNPTVYFPWGDRVTAIVEYSDGSSYEVGSATIWNSLDPSTATVDWEGYVEPLKLGTVNVTAAYGDWPTVTVPVTIVPGDCVETPYPPPVPVGAKLQLRATMRGQDGAKIDVTDQLDWVSWDPAIADFLPVDPVGTITGQAYGWANVDLRLGGAYVNRCNWIQIQVADTFPDSLSVSPGLVNAPLGGSGRLRAQANYLGLGSWDVTDFASWSGTNGLAVEVDSTSVPGTVRAVGPGSSSVRAEFMGLQGWSTVSVFSSPVESIALTPGYVSAPRGSGIYLTAWATLQDTSVIDVTPFAIWGTIDSSVAYFNNEGSTSGSFYASGEGLTQAYAALGDAIGFADLTVTAPTVLDIWIEAVRFEVLEGVETQFWARAQMSDGSLSDVTEDADWMSEDTSVADVSNLPGSKGLVTGSYGGLGANIVASYGGHVRSVWVNVYTPPAPLGPLYVTPNPSMVKVGGKSVLRLLRDDPYCTLGCNLDLTSTATWTSDDPSIASVSDLPGQKGVVTGYHAPNPLPATTTIRATHPTWGTFAATVTVYNPALNGVFLDYLEEYEAEWRQPCSQEMWRVPYVPSGFDIQYFACARYDNGRVHDVTDQAIWSATVPGIVSVSDDPGTRGLASMVGPGSASIKADFGGATASADVNVSAAVLEGLSFESSVLFTHLGATSGSAEMGDMGTVRLSGRYSDGRERNVTAFATIFPAAPGIVELGGFTRRGERIVNAVGPGSTTLTASYHAESAVMPVTVDTRPYLALRAGYDGPSSIPVGFPLRVQAMGFDSVGFPWNASESVTWTSSNSAAATVSNVAGSRGLVTGMAPGFTTITAAVDGLTASVEVGVNDAMLWALEVDPAFDVGPLGSILGPFAAIATYSDGSQFDVTDFASWNGSPSVSPTATPGEYQVTGYGTWELPVSFDGAWAYPRAAGF